MVHLSPGALIHPLHHVGMQVLRPQTSSLEVFCIPVTGNWRQSQEIIQGMFIPPILLGWESSH